MIGKFLNPLTVIMEVPATIPQNPEGKKGRSTRGGTAMMVSPEGPPYLPAPASASQIAHFRKVPMLM